MKYKHNKEDFMQLLKENNLGLSEEQIEGLSELLVNNNALCLPHKPGSTMYGVKQRADESLYVTEVKGVNFEVFDEEIYLYDEDGAVWVPGYDIFPSNKEAEDFIKEYNCE